MLNCITVLAASKYSTSTSNGLSVMEQSPLPPKVLPAGALHLGSCLMLYLVVFWLWRFVFGGCWRPLVVCYVKRSAANVARGTADDEPNQTRALIWLCWHPADHRTEQLLWDFLLTLVPAVIALLCLSLTKCPSFRMTLWRDLPVYAMWLFSHTM